MADLHLATIEALALAIDAKDQTAQSHIRRVQVYAAALARALGMPENEIQGVKTAALLHDIGKLAVPEHILSKPGPLTQEEFQKIRTHPQVGADIISGVPFPYPVAPLILSHHERWDGKGYPAGLKGEEIPLGARILSVVDYFDALMSERPYHKAMSFDAAIGLLQQEAGKALDPRVVADVHRAAAGAAGRSRRRSSSRSRQARRAWTAAGARRGRRPASRRSRRKKNVFEDIALAHREIYALYEIAQAMGTSLGVVGHDGADLVEAEQPRAVLVLRAVPLQRRDRNAALPLRDRRRSRNHPAADDPQRRRASPAGSRATAGRSSTRGRAPTSKPPGLPSATRRCSRRWSARCCSTSGSSARCRSTTPSRRSTRDDHRRLLDRVSEQAAAVINNSMVFEQTQEDSLTDPLTGLPNTRFMFMHLTRELARAERLKSEVSLLVMDLDNFKEINDNHGHHVGDRALREVARRAARRDPAVRHLRPLRRRRVHRRAVGLRRATKPSSKRQELQQRDRRGATSRRARASGCRSAISIGAAVFPHDGDSLRDAARDRRQPDVSGQGPPQAPLA